MGQSNEKNNNRYSIPLNDKLNSDLCEKLAIKKSPDEVSKLLLRKIYYE